MWGQVGRACWVCSEHAEKGEHKTSCFLPLSPVWFRAGSGWCSAAQWRSKDAASCCPLLMAPLGPFVMPRMQEDQSILSKWFWTGLSLYRCVFSSYLDLTLKRSFLGKSGEMQLRLANLRLDLNKDSTLKINLSSPDAPRYIQIGCAHFWLNAPA